ncbi:MAG: hypothetical protein ICV68_17930 [Pyrinomonadaceae bacterium]|nr:hypothetical protein [Pyrinomonadaceae bacterium]
MGMFDDLHKQDLADKAKQAREEQVQKQATKQSSLQTNKQTSLQGNNRTLKQVDAEPSTPTPLPAAPRFDIGTEPYTQATFKFTDDELYALDDLKRDLNRQRELKITKQNLIRYAVHRLVEDYDQNGDESWLV